MTKMLTEAGIEVVGAVWTPRIEAGQTWWSYGDEGSSGKLPDRTMSALAAVNAARGTVIFSNREELMATLAPLPSEMLDRTAELLAARERSIGRPDREAADLLEDAIDDPLDLSDADTCKRVADLISALWSKPVRDACLTIALCDDAVRAQRLWTDLTRATPPPWRAEPAVLLAVTAWIQGDGLIPRAAIDAALEAQPNHGLALLLSLALESGMPPGTLREMLGMAGTGRVWSEE